MASKSLWESFFGVRDSPEDVQGPASLSEDACGDLVHSLARLGYLNNISHSLDGKSFITQERLSQDILLELEKRNGMDVRMSISLCGRKGRLIVFSLLFHGCSSIFLQDV